MKKLKWLLLVLFMMAVAYNASAHEGHHHAKKDTVEKAVTTADTSKTSVNVMQHPKPTGFPTLHPLVVHFPIVLLILAFIFQMIGLFNRKNEWNYVTLGLLAAGVLGAYLAGTSFHPHTEELASDVDAILDRHELFATYTLWTGLAGLVLKAATVFLIKKRKLVFEIVTAVILLLSAISVSEAGHLGAHLTHIDGVGPQGNYLEKE